MSEALVFMSRWQNYLQTLSYSRIHIASSQYGSEYGLVRDICDDRLFIAPLESIKPNIGDTFKVVFIDSKLKEIKFMVSVVRLSESRIEARLVGYEIDCSRFTLDDMQQYWEKKEQV